MERHAAAEHRQDRKTWLTAGTFVMLVLGLVLFLVEREIHREDPVVAAGKADYARYCAECHGAEGRGDSPMASRLDTRPANLRLLARRSGNTFRADDLRTFIDGRAAESAHGARTMPAWGRLFEATPESGRDPNEEVRDRISHITAYIFTLQE